MKNVERIFILIFSLLFFSCSYTPRIKGNTTYIVYSILDNGKLLTIKPNEIDDSELAGPLYDKYRICINIFRKSIVISSKYSGNYYRIKFFNDIKIIDEAGKVYTYPNSSIEEKKYNQIIDSKKIHFEYEILGMPERISREKDNTFKMDIGEVEITDLEGKIIYRGKVPLITFKLVYYQYLQKEIFGHGHERLYLGFAEDYKGKLIYDMEVNSKEYNEWKKSH